MNKSPDPQTPLRSEIIKFLETIDSKGMNTVILDEARNICLQTTTQLEKAPAAANMVNSFLKKNDWFSQHVLYTSFYTAIIVQNLPFSSPRTTEYAMLGAFLHDIGIPALPANLQVRDHHKLDQPSFEIYKTRSILGAELVRKLSLPEPVAQIVLQHHEYVNGSGYPHKLNNIKLYPLAKIVSLGNSIADFGLELNLPPLLTIKQFFQDRYNIDRHDADATRSLIKGFIKGKSL